MPPPIPQQGSRAGLITAVIIFVVLWLLSTVFFFQERGKRQLAENERDAIQNNIVDKPYLPKDLTQGAIKQVVSLWSPEGNAGGEAGAVAGGAGPVILDKNIA